MYDSAVINQLRFATESERRFWLVVAHLLRFCRDIYAFSVKTNKTQFLNNFLAFFPNVQLRRHLPAQICNCIREWVLLGHSFLDWSQMRHFCLLCWRTTKNTLIYMGLAFWTILLTFFSNVRFSRRLPTQICDCIRASIFLSQSLLAQSSLWHSWHGLSVKNKRKRFFEQFSDYQFQCAIQPPSTSSDLRLHQSVGFAWP